MMHLKHVAGSLITCLRPGKQSMSKDARVLTYYLTYYKKLQAILASRGMGDMTVSRFRKADFASRTMTPGSFRVNAWRVVVSSLRWFHRRVVTKDIY